MPTKTITGRATGAVVIGGDYQGLTIARSLGRRGIPAFVIEDEPSIARFSRHTSGTARVAPLRDEETTVATLLSVGRRHGLTDFVLYPTRDENVAAISRNREELSSFYRVPTPPWDCVRWAWDKRLTHRMAVDLDIPTASTWHTSEPGELETIDWSFPLVIKPAIKEHFIYVTKVKAWRAETPGDLRSRFHRASQVIPPEEVMVQELIPGGGERQFSYCAFVKEGRAIGTMVTCRLRQRPLDFGRSSTFVKTVEVPELEELSLRFLSAIDYYGLVELEYKFDERDGQYKLLDVNPRTWGYHSLGRSAGVDFSWLLFRDQRGETVPPVRAKPGVAWVRLSTDVPTALGQIARREIGVAKYLRALARTDTEAVFAWDDPLPTFVELLLLPYLYQTRTRQSEGS